MRYDLPVPGSAEIIVEEYSDRSPSIKGLRFTAGLNTNVFSVSPEIGSGKFNGISPYLVVVHYLKCF